MNKKIKDKQRGIAAFCYFVAFILLLIFFVYKSKFIFYNEAKNDFSNYPRLIWCIAWVFFGFSRIAYRASLSKHRDNQECKKSFLFFYIVSYSIVLLLVSSINFAFFNIFQATNNYLFYFLSAPVGFVLGYHADKARVDPLGLFSILKPK